jgi:hypothetical protein
MIDLHCESHELDDRPFHELYRRSEVVPVGEQSIRMFGPEDHMRLLGLHFLRHGAWRPLWLCDIAAAVEGRPIDFDWDYFLSGDPRRTEWTIGAIGLAHRILGARIEDTPIAVQARRLPSWLVPAVLCQWEKGKNHQAHGECIPWSHIARRPSSALEVLRTHWPSPIVATVSRRAPLNEVPRLPIQIADLVARGATSLRRAAYSEPAQ